MKVKIYQATLVIQEKEVPLTKARAKQFPILQHDLRWMAAERGENAPEPIAKVAGKVLGDTQDWLYLVEDDVAGLAWISPVVPNRKWATMMIEKGGWIDDPSQVPTIIS